MIADISVYQGNIDWDKARKELEMAIFRASVGDKKDTKYVTNADTCSIPYGAYHYVKTATESGATQEAKFFVQCARKAKKEPLFYIGDIQYKAQNSTNTEKICIAFLNQLRRLGCKRIGLYIGGSYYGWAKSAIQMCDVIWIPRWGKNTGQIPPKEYEPKHYCDIWQYTSKGSVKGISGRVDLNKLHGNKDLNWFTGGETTVQKPVEQPKISQAATTVKFTGKHLAQYARGLVEAGAVYWYGCCGYKCSKSLYENKSKQFPSHYTSDRSAKYKQHIIDNKVAMDCVGLNYYGPLVK